MWENDSEVSNFGRKLPNFQSVDGTLKRAYQIIRDNDDEEIENVSKANLAVQKVIDEDDVNALRYLVVFTNQEGFQFQKEIPSKFFTKLIIYLKGITQNQESGLCALQIISNMWREFDEKFDLLVDPELVTLVCSIALSGINAQTEILSLQALTYLTENKIEALQGFFTPQTFEKFTQIFRVALKSTESTPLLTAIINFFLKASIYKDLKPILSPIIQIVNELLGYVIDDDLFVISLNLISSLAEDVDCERIISQLGYTEKITGLLVQSKNHKHLMAGYHSLKSIAKDKMKLFIQEDMLNLLTAHLVEFASVPSLELYEHIENLTHCFTSEVFKFGLFHTLLKISDNLCFENKKFCAYCMCVFLTENTSPEIIPFRIEYMKCGAFQYICDLIASDPVLIVNFMDFFTSIIQLDPQGAVAIMNDSGLIDEIQSFAEENESEGVNEALTYIKSIVRVFLQE
ncbi:hypothetical protein GPJ56_011031 [Histomonas meleagridis]|uniref:uncharacterized protein n=1 Tax=Histomonas meleagridis TaxID=135588 RepID=UPI00355A84BF|nr:hypothetical protein GPJ56_011031 [Histomonas meleagridis]KAH0800808.1 hypothetical protein GO595_006561 [Histomonas meleagridis]